MNEPFRQIIETEIQQALAYFVGRQILVARALVSMGLDPKAIGKYKTAAWASPLMADDDKIVAENAVEQAGLGKIAQSGLWYDDEHAARKYFLHGGGCRLTNIDTDEEIDWNCPDVQSFDPFSFVKNLEWQLTSRVHMDAFQALQEKRRSSTESDFSDEIIQTLVDMRGAGVINPDWTLPDKIGK